MRPFSFSLVFFLFAAANPLFAAHVSRVSKGFFLADGDDGKRWQMGETVCATRLDQAVGCGRVAKVTGGFAWVRVAQLNSRTKAIEVGDSVQRYASRSTASTLESSAYSRGMGGLEFGIHGGIPISNLSGVPSGASSTQGVGYTVSPASSKSGFLGGIEVGRRINRNFSVSTEFNAVSRGTAFTETVPSVSASADATVNLVYFQIPTLVRGELDFGVFHPFLLAGPSFAFAIVKSATFAVTGGTNSGASSGSVDLNSFDIGFYGGAGVALQLAPTWRLNFMTRYYLGLSDVDPAGSGIHNRALEFLTGFSWDI